MQQPAITEGDLARETAPLAATPSVPDEAAILPDALASRGFEFAQAFSWVRANEGKSALRQFAEMLGIVGRRKFSPEDYYLLGLFRRELGRAGRRAFLSPVESNALNDALNDRALLTQLPLANDKLLAGFVFERIGLPVARLIGHASTLARFRSPATVTTPEALVALWRSPGALPCFGKPVHGSRALGTAILTGMSADGQSVMLGDGRQVEALRLAREIFSSHAEGYLLQELLTNEAQLAAAIGSTVAGVRITTVQTAGGPRVLYATIRMPAPGAMSDANIGGRQVRGNVDIATGKITRAQDMFRMSVTDQTTHPVTGAVLPGLQLPHWTEAVDAALRGHQVFVDAGIIGWDVMLTDRGPVVAEANSNPLHETYQRPSGRGLLNPDLAPLIDEARAYVAERRKQRKA